MNAKPEHQQTSDNQKEIDAQTALLEQARVKKLTTTPTALVNQSSDESVSVSFDTSTKQNITPATQSHTTSPTPDAKQEPAPALNFNRYAQEDATQQLARQKEDTNRTKQWSREDKAALDKRNNEGFLTRLTRKITSDASSDEEIEKNRNKSISKKYNLRYLQK